MQINIRSRMPGMLNTDMSGGIRDSRIEYSWGKVYQQFKQAWISYNTKLLVNDREYELKWLAGS